ncbi:MAG: exodeoxyribonuclease VII large subunit [Candidatus Dormibacteraeota bacterium]|nr:exodeoxyribonuclease VII large subunit [Candidatus Dormibacteraeota bacterium]
MLQLDEARRPLTVTELAAAIQRELRPLNSVFVKGEVTGLRRSAKGHFNFSITDPSAVVEAFLFAGDARRLGIVPEDGQAFVFRGRVDFWPQGGRVRLVVDLIQHDDAGRRRAQLEALRRRLELEGAFAPERKRRLPFLPRVVALVTSPTGAVIHDLQETIRDRYPNMEIVVYAAVVQGDTAPSSVVSALTRCNREARADVVVVARGGGSFEELWAFNTEPVARAILASRIPVVTALGHTSDRTLADLVADAECRTPTEAGTHVVPRKADLLAALADRGRRLDRETARRLAEASERLAHRRRRLAPAVTALVRRRADRLESCRSQLGRLEPRRQVTLRLEHLALLDARLSTAAARAVAGRAAQVQARRGRERLDGILRQRLRGAETGVAHRRGRLDALSPERVLARGYSITSDERGAVLRNAADTGAGRQVRVRLARGSLRATVDERIAPGP